MKQIRIEVKGKSFLLQHPGAKWALEMQQEAVGNMGTVNMLKILEEGFENCVFPEEGTKLDLDSLGDDIDAANIWRDILVDFVLNGTVLKDKKNRWKVLEEPKKKALQNKSGT